MAASLSSTTSWAPPRARFHLVADHQALEYGSILAWFAFFPLVAQPDFDLLARFENGGIAEWKNLLGRIAIQQYQLGPGDSVYLAGDVDRQ